MKGDICRVGNAHTFEPLEFITVCSGVCFAQSLVFCEEFCRIVWSFFDLVSDYSFDLVSDYSFDLVSDYSFDLVSDYSFDLVSDYSFGFFKLFLKITANVCHK